MNAKLSATGSGIDSDTAPVTSSMIVVGIPSWNWLRHDKLRFDPTAWPARFVGAAGGSGTFTAMRTSFDAALRGFPLSRECG